MWYIMSMNQVRGLFNGAFDSIHQLFFEKPSEDEYGHYLWTNYASQAMGFPTYDQARAYAINHWPVGMVDRSFGIVELKVVEPADDFGGKEREQKRRDFQHRIVHRDPELIDELQGMAKNRQESGLTWPEAQIIKLFTSSERR